QIAARPTRQRIERHHVGPALPGETGQPLCAQLPFAVAAIPKDEINLVRIAVARSFRYAVRGFQSEDVALFYHVPMCERQFTAVCLWIEAEDGVKSQVLRKMRMQPTHVGRAAFRPRPPAVVHGRNAVDRERFTPYRDRSLEVPGLIEMTVV